jgi:hypothetical protein
MKAGKPAGVSEKVIRLLEIYTMIAQKQFPSVPSLKEHFHVSERAVYRYLEIINMIDGIEYDRDRKPFMPRAARKTADGCEAAQVPQWWGPMHNKQGKST